MGFRCEERRRRGALGVEGCVALGLLVSRRFHESVKIGGGPTGHGWTRKPRQRDPIAENHSSDPAVRCWRPEQPTERREDGFHQGRVCVSAGRGMACSCVRVRARVCEKGMAAVVRKGGWPMETPNK